MSREKILSVCPQLIFLSLGQRLRHVNLLGTTQKVVSVIEMTHPYGVWYIPYSVVLLRPKKVKLLTQSAEKWICIEKRA